MTHTNHQFNFNATFKKVYSSQWLIWIIITVGILVRVRQYIADRSLWLDESMLSSNILNRTFSGLLQPLDFGQGAPIGFLFLEKLAVLTGGPSEYSLRFFPLLSGVIALVVFYKVSVRYIKNEAVPISVLLFSFCYPLIRYSSEVKQYSTDVLIASILYLLGSDFLSRQSGNRKYVIFGLVGALSIWFSHVSVFVLAGIGTVDFIMHLYSHEWE